MSAQGPVTGMKSAGRKRIGEGPLGEVASQLKRIKEVAIIDNLSPKDN